jgi:hypothetical protein
VWGCCCRRGEGGGGGAGDGSSLGSAGSPEEYSLLWLVDMVSAVHWGDSGEDAGKLLECSNLAVVRWRERRSGRWMLKRGDSYKLKAFRERVRGCWEVQVACSCRRRRRNVVLLWIVRGLCGSLGVGSSLAELAIP